MSINLNLQGENLGQGGKLLSHRRYFTGTIPCFLTVTNKLANPERVTTKLCGSMGLGQIVGCGVTRP